MFAPADPGLPTLIASPYFRSAISSAIHGWRRVVVTATQLGIPVPGGVGTGPKCNPERVRFLDGSQTAQGG